MVNLGRECDDVSIQICLQAPSWLKQPFKSFSVSCEAFEILECISVLNRAIRRPELLTFADDRRQTVGQHRPDKVLPYSVQ